jgi:hypothetical protein
MRYPQSTWPKLAMAAALALAIAPSPVALADDTHHTILAAEYIQWGPSPPVLRKGDMAVLVGDPGKAELFVIRGRFPDGSVFPPHWHSQAENVTVLQGTFHLGAGEEFDKTKATPVTVGGFFSMPGGMRHFAWTEGETVLEVKGVGPFDINYVNPADAPNMN